MTFIGSGAMRCPAMLLAIALVTGCTAGGPSDGARPMPAGAPHQPMTLDREAASRGRAIAVAGCASCHAIDREGASAFPAATPFRDVVRRRSLDDIEAAMARGLVTSHPAMPPYAFRAAEIDDLRAYLETLRD